MKVARLKTWLRSRRLDLGALAVIVLVFFAAFGWAIFRGKFLIGGDVFFYTYPMRTVAWRMIRHKEVPLWTPEVLSGFPLLAMVQLGLAYPLTWAHLLLPDHWAEEILVLAPFILSPAFTYVYAREIGRTRLASLLAGLAFGYSGLTTNALGMNGIPINALMWMPLLLIALERSRRSFKFPLLGATAVYSLSVLTGHAQSFLLVGIAGGAYALFLFFTPSNPDDGEPANRQTGKPLDKSWTRCQPLLVVVLAYVFSTGVAAFQILETLRAARRSIRKSITYEFFSLGSFTLREAVLSFLAPLYHYIDVSTFVAPLACALALYAVIHRARHRDSADLRPWFWLAVAALAFAFMLGEHTPLYRLAYHIPLLNLFRVPSRHAFEWSFALAILGAYGWDAFFVSRKPSLPDNQTGAQESSLAPECATQQPERLRSIQPRQFVTPLVALCALIGVLWFLSVNRIALFGILPVTQSSRLYLAWKFIFTLSVLAGFWLASSTGKARQREIFLVIVLLLGCMIEPLILISRWWPGTAKPGARFTTPALATRYLQPFPASQNRVYTRANLGVDENATAPRVDVLDQPALFGIQNAGGYEPLLLERYSRAFGNVDYDAVRPLAGYAPSSEVFEPQSQVLDLLNVTHVVAFEDLNRSSPPGIMRHEGFDFTANDLSPEIKPDESVTLDAAGASGDALILVTSLANSVMVADNTPAAHLRIHLADASILDRELLVGRDTSEWAHERRDVRALMKHRLAPIFDTRPGDTANSFLARRYWAHIPLGALRSVSTIEITNSMQSAVLSVWKATVYDDKTHVSTPVARPKLDPERWHPEAAFDGVIVLRNTRALPRAWLVTDAKAVAGETALGCIRGMNNQTFDPRQTALLEVSARDLPRLPGGNLPEGSKVRLATYESKRLIIETDAPSPTLLVTSEIFYPGWEATVDGVRTPILVTNYLLRGIALTTGHHRIEMLYRPPSARNGAAITSGTILILISLVILAGRGHLRARKTRAKNST